MRFKVQMVAVKGREMFRIEFRRHAVKLGPNHRTEEEAKERLRVCWEGAAGAVCADSSNVPAMGAVAWITRYKLRRGWI